MTAIATVSLLTGLFVFAGNALAVHDEGMQLDGDLSALCPPGSPPPLPLCTASQKDWSDLFIVTDTPAPAPGTEAVTNNTSIIGAAGSPFTHGTFIRDFESGTTNANCAIDSLATTKFCTGDDTTFATGSKDTLDINPNPGGWQCNHDNNVNSKIDIMNAYAVAYTIPGTPAPGTDAGDKIMYFGLEKNKDNGVNDVGFWFLQGNSDCSAPTGAEDFTGTHTIGDVLVVSEYTRGGGVSNITAYRWVGGSNPLAQIGTAGDCKGSSGGDTMCATTNSGAILFNTTAATPWLTSDATLGVGRNQIVPPDFFEGGINLTKAFAGTGTPPPSCFNTFIADTRSSKETGATLFDYARGELGQCGASITTQQSDADGSVTPGALVHDTATITGTSGGGGVPPFPSSDESTGGSNVKFYICELLASGDCTSTAVQVGNADGEELSPTATPGQSTATSDDYDTTGKTPGRYCFYAVWPGDSNYTTGASGGAAATECFTISDTTGATSAQTWVPNDSATVASTNGALLNGTLKIELYESSDCTGTSVTGQTYSKSVTGVASSTLVTNNTTYSVTATKTVSWLTTFTSTDANVSGTTHCEITALTITN